MVYLFFWKAPISIIWSNNTNEAPLLYEQAY